TGSRRFVRAGSSASRGPRRNATPMTRARSSSRDCERSPARPSRPACKSGSSRSTASAARTGRRSRPSPRRSRCSRASPTLQFAAWHLWNTETVLEDIEREAPRFVGVHVADWGEPTRGWADRVLPGEGVAALPTILSALDSAGWDGFYDLEIFSDNGTFGNA